MLRGGDGRSRPWIGFAVACRTPCASHLHVADRIGVQIDLGASHPLHAILVWHYHSQARVYRDVVVQVSDDATFKKGVTTVFNNDHDNSAKLGGGPDKEYIEVAEGKLIDPKGVKGRYVRLLSNGNTTNDLNHYVEVEVYGSPK